MRRRTLSRSATTILLLLLSGGGALAQNGALAEVPQRLETARAQIGTPGLSVAIAQGDRLVWSGGSGLADVEQEVPATADTVYRIASISKPIAATAVMQLVERGRVRLDDPITRYVAEFPQKGEVTITVRQIMTHTSGIRHYNPGEMENVTAYSSLHDAIAIFKDDPLLFTPGTRYSYSSYAYNLLAGVVESASGLSYEAYLQEHIFEPAGMTRTYLDRPQQIVKHRARQYVRDGGRGVRNAPYADLSIKWAGGGVISTAEDLLRFHLALEAGRLLKPETLERMYEPAQLTDGSRTTYGLGWMVRVDEHQHRWVAHSGGATGGTTYLLRNAEHDVAVAILCNVQSANGLAELAQELAELTLNGTGSR